MNLSRGWAMYKRRAGAQLLALCCVLSFGLEGCAVVAVADAGITVVATAVKVSANVVGAGVNLVTGGDKKK